MTTLYTIGHSTHTLWEFIALLQAHKIKHLIDVRSIPKSRHVPWFNKNELKVALQAAKITYEHLPELGGLRHTHKDSINQAWNNLSFRGYADYMQSPEFYQALKKLNQHLRKKGRTAIMCAEALPWRCHRSLIGDAEVVRRIKVLDILSITKLHPHQLTSFAVVDRTKKPIKVFYPKQDIFEQ